MLLQPFVVLVVELPEVKVVELPVRVLVELSVDRPPVVRERNAEKRDQKFFILW